jgi:hypothetical protein
LREPESRSTLGNWYTKYDIFDTVGRTNNS